MEQFPVVVLATHNRHKIREFGEIFGASNIESDDPMAEETEDSFGGNALLKARAVKARHPGAVVIADDSGLQVESLGGAPGVYSARYAGKDGDSEANNALLLKNLGGAKDRSASFVCAIAYIGQDGSEHLFTGVSRGRIAFAPSGVGGFGYDPLFIPDGFSKTFAELSPEEKNSISHRARAIAELKKYLASAKA